MVDLRKDKRAPASLKVKYKSATVDEFREQIGTDISRGGIFIKTKKPIENGAVLKLELQLSDASPVIHGIGRVCWRREESTDPEFPSGMGIKFIKLEPSSRAVVERIIQGRGDRLSRFDQTMGAELAPPSQPPPSATTPVAPKPVTDLFDAARSTIASMPSVSAAVTAPSMPSAPSRASMPRAGAPQTSAVPRATAPQTSAAPRPAAPQTSAIPRPPSPQASAAPRAPQPAAPAPAAPLPAAVSRAPVASPLRPTGARGDLPPPPASMLRGGAPGTPSAKPSAGAGAVAGLFANSPLITSTPSIEPTPETTKRSSFFPAVAPNGNDSVRPSSRPSVPGFTGSGRLKPPPSTGTAVPGPKPGSGSGSLKPATRADQARQSGQFLAAAFATGGVAEETATQARVVAERGEDSMIDDLFAAVVQEPPAATGKAAGNVEDVFEALSHEEGLNRPPASDAPPPAGRASSAGISSGAGRDSVPSAAALRRASIAGLQPLEGSQATRVDQLFDELDARDAGHAQAVRSSKVAAAPTPMSSFVDDQDLGDGGDEAAPPPNTRSWGPEVGDQFGEADLFNPVSLPPQLPLNPEDAGVSLQLAVPDAAKRANQLRAIVIGLIAALVVAGAFLYYQRSVATPQIVVRKLPERAPSASTVAAPPVQVAPAAQPAHVEQAAAPVPAHVAQPAAQAVPAAAPAPVEAVAVQNVEVEISSVPRDSDIAVDGQKVGTTPKHIGLPLGREAHVTIGTSGYAAMTKTVVASAGMEPLRFKLEPLPYSLVVHSTPAEAVITVGSHSAIAPAPLDLGHLEGVVQVSVSKDGYQRVTRALRIDEFVEKDGVMRTELDVALNPLPAVPHSHSKHAHTRTGADAPPAPESTESGEATAPAAGAAAANEAPAAAPPPAKPAAEAPAPAPEAPASP